MLDPNVGTQAFMQGIQMGMSAREAAWRAQQAQQQASFQQQMSLREQALRENEFQANEMAREQRQQYTQSQDAQQQANWQAQFERSGSQWDQGFTRERMNDAMGQQRWTTQQAQDAEASNYFANAARPFLPTQQVPANYVQANPPMVDQLTPAGGQQFQAMQRMDPRYASQAFGMAQNDHERQKRLQTYSQVPSHIWSVADPAYIKQALSDGFPVPSDGIANLGMDSKERSTARYFQSPQHQADVANVQQLIPSLANAPEKARAFVDARHQGLVNEEPANVSGRMVDPRLKMITDEMGLVAKHPSFAIDQALKKRYSDLYSQYRQLVDSAGHGQAGPAASAPDASGKLTSEQAIDRAFKELGAHASTTAVKARVKQLLDADAAKSGMNNR